MTPPLVHLVDDERAVRQALTRLLMAAGYATASYGSAEEFLAGDHAAPGCVVADLHLPGLDGLQLQAWLAQHASQLPVVFLTGRGDIAISVRAMKGGAIDFLTKPVDGTALIGAVAQALQVAHSACVHQTADADLDNRMARLTPREVEVMNLVVAGLLNKQIAAELGIAEKTIKVHRGRVMQKMKVRTVADLVRLVVLHRG